jgi:recombination protein RecA
MEGTAQRLESLRRQIRKLQAAPRTYLAVLKTGIAELDSWMSGGGLPMGQVIELSGEAASGRTSLALRAIAAATREKRLAAYIDGPGELYPPVVAGMGVDLERLLIVRPKAPKQLVWTALQLARSGVFACVALDLTHTGLQLSLVEAKKLSDATFKGGCCTLLLAVPRQGSSARVRFELTASDPWTRRLEALRCKPGSRPQISIPCASLLPGNVGDPLFRDSLAAGSNAHASLDDAPPVKRIKMVWERDGGGIDRNRPGRDVALPSMRTRMGN